MYFGSVYELFRHQPHVISSPTTTLLPYEAHQMLVGVLLQCIDLILILLHGRLWRAESVLAGELLPLAQVVSRQSI